MTIGTEFHADKIGTIDIYTYVREEVADPLTFEGLSSWRLYMYICLWLALHNSPYFLVFKCNNRSVISIVAYQAFEQVWIQPCPILIHLFKKLLTKHTAYTD